MKEGQEQFLTFILDRTKEDKKEKMQALLAEMFERQQTGKLNVLDDKSTKTFGLFKTRSH